ncbi:MAG: YbaK/EbsC family protein [Candidatus Kerfeldbacteria bacterium]|nr:YbaK/EbsC family protein [Candidatus Kerfeldbacteria bacterium]
MALSKKVITMLEKGKAAFEVVEHRTVYTAYDLAQTLKMKMQEIAKTLLVKVDSAYYLVVIPAHYKLDLPKVKKLFKAKKVQIAREGEMKKKFNVKPGAITAFGTVHKVGVVMDKALLKAQRALFGAGSFTESVRMKVKDYMKLEGDNLQTAVIAKRDATKK